MIGKFQKERARSPRAWAAAGFTLLELMIVISIVIILASIALPQYQKTIMHTRETVLRDNLFKMRSLIDQFAADKGRLPQSVDELVTEGYMREVQQLATVDEETKILVDKKWQGYFNDTL